jgi:ribonuclease P protein component
MPRIVRSLSQFTQHEVNTLFKNARRVAKHTELHILLAPQQKDFGRILIVASRKVGNAPTRNKIRRRLKAIFYEQKLYQKGYDCLIIVKRECAQLTFAALQEILVKAYAQQGLS